MALLAITTAALVTFLSSFHTILTWQTATYIFHPIHELMFSFAKESPPVPQNE